jgi:hypothetical protein
VIASGRLKVVNTKKNRCVPNVHKLAKIVKSVRKKMVQMVMLKLLKRSTLLLMKMVRRVITKKSRSLLRKQRRTINLIMIKKMLTRKSAIGRPTLTRWTRVLNSIEKITAIQSILILATRLQLLQIHPLTSLGHPK